MKKVKVVRIDPEFRTIRLIEIEHSLESFQKEVGGNVEVVPFASNTSDFMFVNENGSFRKDFKSWIFGKHTLYGPAIVLGRRGEEAANVTVLPTHVKEHVTWLHPYERADALEIISNEPIYVNFGKGKATTSSSLNDLSSRIDFELEELEKMNNLADLAGGTFSSRHLRYALAARQQAVSWDQVGRADKLIVTWREALARHNNQEKKFTTYDLNTGEPIE